MIALYRYSEEDDVTTLELDRSLIEPEPMSTITVRSLVDGRYRKNEDDIVQDEKPWHQNTNNQTLL